MQSGPSYIQPLPESYLNIKKYYLENFDAYVAALMKYPKLAEDSNCFTEEFSSSQEVLYVERWFISMIVLGVLNDINKAQEDAFISAVNAWFITARQNMTRRINFFAFFFTCLGAASEIQENTRYIEILMNLSFLNNLECFSADSMYDSVIDCVFLQENTVAGKFLIDALFKRNFELDTQPLTHALMKKKDYSAAARLGVNLLLARPEYELIGFENPEFKTFFELKAVELYIQTLAHCNCIFLDASLKITKISKRSSSGALSAILRTKNSFSAVSLEALVKMLCSYNHILEACAKNLDPKTQAVELIEKLKVILDALTPSQFDDLENQLGEKLYSNLSIAMIRYSIAIYHNKNKTVKKWLEGQVSFVRKAPTHEKEQFLRLLLECYEGKLQYSVAQIYEQIHTKKESAIVSDVELNAWLTNTILFNSWVKTDRQVSVKETLLWFSEDFLQEKFRGFRAMEQYCSPAAGVDTSATMHAKASSESADCRRTSMRYSLALNVRAQALSQESNIPIQQASESIEANSRVAMYPDLEARRLAESTIFRCEIQKILSRLSDSVSILSLISESRVAQKVSSNSAADASSLTSSSSSASYANRGLPPTPPVETVQPNKLIG